MRPTPTFPLLATLAALVPLAILAGAAKPLEPKAPATDQLARKSMERVVERYRTLKTYRLEGVASTTVSTRTEHNETGRSMRFLVQRPGRLSSLARESQFTTLTVANGESLWTAVPELGQYTAESLAKLYAASADSAGLRQQLDPASDYVRLLDGVTRIQALSRDTVRTARGVVQCERYALTRAAADSAGPGITIHPRVVWVDPATRLIVLDSLRVDQNHPQLGPVSSVSITRMVVAEADPALAASTFTFHPEDGARRVRRFMQRSPEHEALEGQPATDFTLETLADAKPVRLSDLKGRVVLLDFWATWCGPCRRWLPIVEQAHRDYAAKGLSVFAVNEREPESKVHAYLDQQKLDLPVLMDRSGTVGSIYRASSIPLTVVIGRDGNVFRIMVGLHEEADLKDVLHDAGID
jgi:thiol-disulfide isomerase/thioredoxin/outer membrane lipoprotein-sorting protein